MMHSISTTVGRWPARVAVLCTTLLLSACATQMGPPLALQPYTGKPVQALIADYGRDYSGTKSAAGATYVWHITGTRIVGGYRDAPTPQVTTSGGAVVTGMAPGAYHPPRLETLSCTLRAQVDGQGNVSSSQAEGGGCYDLLNFPQLRDH